MLRGRTAYNARNYMLFLIVAARDKDGLDGLHIR